MLCSRILLQRLSGRLWCNKKIEKILKKLIDVGVYEKETKSDGSVSLFNRTPLVRARKVSVETLDRIYEATKIMAGDPRRC